MFSRETLNAIAIEKSEKQTALEHWDKVYLREIAISLAMLVDLVRDRK